MTQKVAESLFDALLAAGFTGGIDCACFCLDGHYGRRSKKWGQARTERWAVSCTPMDLFERLKAVVERQERLSYTVDHGTYTITDWSPATSSGRVS